MMGPPMGMRPPGMPQQVPPAQPPPMGGLSEDKLQVYTIFRHCVGRHGVYKAKVNVVRWTAIENSNLNYIGC